MNARRFTLSFPALLCTLGLATAQTSTVPTSTSSASAALEAPAGPLTLSFESLKGARFVTLPARIEGDASVVTSGQLQQAMAAVNRNLGAALQLKYPLATITTDAGDATAVMITAVLVAPKALTMFDALTARLEVRFPGDPRIFIVKQSYGLLSLAAAGGNADMVVLNGLTAQLP